MRMVRRKGIARSKMKGSEKNAECSYTMFCMLPAKRDQERYQQQVGGLQERETVYIGPQR